jgi:hypothetical protein
MEREDKSGKNVVYSQRRSQKTLGNNLVNLCKDILER